MKMNLDARLERVASKSTFLDFVEALRNDKMDENEKEKISPSSPYASGANEWENETIETFLDALYAFGKDSSHVSAKPSWKTFALLLYAGKFYE